MDLAFPNIGDNSELFIAFHDAFEALLHFFKYPLTKICTCSFVPTGIKLWPIIHV
jgi:hypothetical protein